MASRSIRTTVTSVVADAEAIRAGWPARHPSPKKSPGPSMATTPDFPRSETTVSVTCLFQGKTRRPLGRLERKTTCFFRYAEIDRPVPAFVRNAFCIESG